ncbi:MAG: insulinase family protein [Firmicutes bacterium]|nr:insulinase family protein [Bacillota bacterium]
MIQVKTLPCGARLVTEKLPEFRSASIGIWVGAGAVKEASDRKGISHFIEHMCFKGTEKRNFLQLAKEADDLGAALNAFTDKEATCYHIKALTDVFPQAVDILLDMVCFSKNDAAEIRKEKRVVTEEIAMVEDTPDDIIVDILMEKVFRGTPLQYPVLGSRRTVRVITREDVLAYRKKWYTAGNIVVAAVGNFDDSALEEQLEAQLSMLPSKSPEIADYKPSEGCRYGYRTQDINQTHIAIGLPTVSMGSGEYYAQAIACDILGGSMSSRLFQNIREQKGLAYSVFSSTLSYAQDGMFMIYAGITPGKEVDAVTGIAGELAGLKRDGISKEETEIVKQRLKSGYIFSLESMNSRMYRLGRNLLLLDKVYSQEDTMAEIDAVTADQVNAFLDRICDIGKYSGVAISSKRIDMKRLMNG